jgi:hypothetical protein
VDFWNCDTSAVRAFAWYQLTGTNTYTELGRWAASGLQVMTGGVTLPTDPTTAMQAVTKQYSDAHSSPNVGRNLVHNGMFNVQQRGTGPFTTANTYTADRWEVTATAPTTLSVAIAAASAGNVSQIGDEACKYLLLNSFTGDPAAGGYLQLVQPIEGVRRLSGKTVTVSFWATSDFTSKLGVSLDQYFGTGGSPSAAVMGAGQAVALSSATTFSRYSLTFTVPSATGMTLGTNHDDCTHLVLWYSAGSSFPGRSGGVGVQTGDIWIWGLQLEIGSVMTPLEHPDPQQELAKAQRFFQAGNFNVVGYNLTGNQLGGAWALPVVMRASPTIVPTYSNVNISSPNVVAMSPGYLSAYANVTATGNAQVNGSFTASADL